MPAVALQRGLAPDVFLVQGRFKLRRCRSLEVIHEWERKMTFEVAIAEGGFWEKFTKAKTPRQ